MLSDFKLLCMQCLFYAKKKKQQQKTTYNVRLRAIVNRKIGRFEVVHCRFPSDFVKENRRYGICLCHEDVTKTKDSETIKLSMSKKVISRP